MYNQLYEINSNFDVLLTGHTIESAISAATIQLGLFRKNAPANEPVHEPVLELEYWVHSDSPFFVLIDNRRQLHQVREFLRPISAHVRPDRFRLLTDRNTEQARGIQSSLIFVPWAVDPDVMYRIAPYIIDRHLIVHMAPEKYYERSVNPPSFIARDSDGARTVHYIQHHVEFKDFEMWLEGLRGYCGNVDIHSFHSTHELNGHVTAEFTIVCQDQSEVKVRAYLYYGAGRGGAIYSVELHVPARYYGPSVWSDSGPDYDHMLDSMRYTRHPGRTERFDFSGIRPRDLYDGPFKRRTFAPPPVDKQVYIGPQLGGTGWVPDRDAKGRFKSKS